MADLLQNGLAGSRCSPRDSQEFYPTPPFKSISSSVFGLLCAPTLTSIHDDWKNHSFDLMDLCWQSNVSAFFFFVTGWFFFFFLFFSFFSYKNPPPSSLLPPHTIPLGRPSVPAPSIQHRASNPDWHLVSYMIFYMFQCHSPKSSHPLPLLQSP